MITSTKNPQIQKIRRLQNDAKTRRATGSFVVEGVRLVEEALLSAWIPQIVYFTEGLNKRGRLLLDRFVEEGVRATEVSLQVLRIASDTQTPQGILAIFPMKEYLDSSPNPDKPEPKRILSSKSLLKKQRIHRLGPKDFVLIVDKVRDPGNLGTILRTALGAGVDEVLISPGSVDPFAPKVLRSAMGAHFRIPVRRLPWTEIRSKVVHLHVFLAASSGSLSYTRADFRSPLAMILGGEADGPGQESLDLADSHVHIPMPGDIESLNVATAGAILLFEIVRQRMGTDGE